MPGAHLVLRPATLKGAPCGTGHTPEHKDEGQTAWAICRGKSNRLPKDCSSGFTQEAQEGALAHHQETITFQVKC